MTTVRKASILGVRDMQHSISIVIVNWNAGPLLRDCVESIVCSGFGSGYVREVILVDNGSSDDSILLTQELAGGWPVRIVFNAENRGFAAACNQGAALANGTLLLFLNPDCRLVPGALQRCADLLNRDPTVGVVGVALESAPGVVSRSCDYFPTVVNFLFKIMGLSKVSTHFSDGSMRDWPHTEDRRVDHVIGAFYMVRAEEFRWLGGFDERFFVYYEDLDLSCRYQAIGKDRVFLAWPHAHHTGGGSSSKAKALRLFFNSRSRVLYAFKHFSPFDAWLHLIATLLLEPVTRVCFLVATRRFAEVSEVFRAFWLLYGDLPATLRSARKR